MDLKKYSFSDEVENALSVLVENGFLALGEAKLEDARDLFTGKRTRTFRHARRYFLVLALKNAPEDDPIDNMSYRELQQAAREVPGIGNVSKIKKIELIDILKKFRENPEAFKEPEPEPVPKTEPETVPEPEPGTALESETEPEKVPEPETENETKEGQKTDPEEDQETETETEKGQEPETETE